MTTTRISLRLRRIPVQCVIFTIELYRTYVSPLRLPSCRFVPTCSQYAVDALTEYGLIRGGWLAAVRLAKCGPWHRGGWDPVPERRGDHRGELRDDVWGTPALRGENASHV
jgi:uncharacterized protein